MAMEKTSFILENEFARTILKGALKSLKYVSVLVLDLKLATIVTLLEAYVLEQEELIKRKNAPQQPLDVQYGYDRPDQPTDPTMPWR